MGMFDTLLGRLTVTGGFVVSLGAMYYMHLEYFAAFLEHVSCISGRTYHHLWFFSFPFASKLMVVKTKV